MGNRLIFVQRSYQGHANHCVTFVIECLGKRQEIKAWFQRKLPMDYQMVTMIDDVTWPPKGQTRDPNTLRAHISIETAGDAI